MTLSVKNEEDSYMGIHYEVKLSGFGKMNDEEDKFRHIKLREVAMTMMPEEFCWDNNDWWNQYNLRSQIEGSSAHVSDTKCSRMW